MFSAQSIHDFENWSKESGKVEREEIKDSPFFQASTSIVSWVVLSPNENQKSYILLFI